MCLLPLCELEEKRKGEKRKEDKCLRLSDLNKGRMQKPNQLPPRVLDIQERKLSNIDHIDGKETSPAIKLGQREFIYTFTLSENQMVEVVLISKWTV